VLPPSPTMLKRYVALELRRLREAAGSPVTRALPVCAASTASPDGTQSAVLDSADSTIRLKVSPDGSLLASGGHGTLQISDTHDRSNSL
jgi:hypothetical protein